MQKVSKNETGNPSVKPVPSRFKIAGKNSDLNISKKRQNCTKTLWTKEGIRPDMEIQHFQDRV